MDGAPAARFAQQLKGLIESGAGICDDEFRSIDADKMLLVVGNPQLEMIAKQVNEKLRRVIDSI